MKKYLAGIFDAEGHVRIRRYSANSYIPSARVCMCNKEIIMLFVDKYNAAYYTEDRGENRKLVHIVNFTSKTLRESSFLSDVLPFLQEKRLLMQKANDILNLKIDREECYQEYMKVRRSFLHPLKGEITNEYLAGVIDGDGWLSMFRSCNNKDSIYNKFRVGLEQRYKPMVEYLALTYSGNSLYKTKTYSSKHTQTYSWQHTTEKVLPLLENIAPYLIEKKKLCEILIKYIKEYEKFRKISSKTLEEFKSFGGKTKQYGI